MPPEACDFFAQDALVTRNDLGPAVRKDGRWNAFIVAPFQLHSNGSVTNDGVAAFSQNRAGNRSPVASVELNARKRLLPVINTCKCPARRTTPRDPC